MNKTNEPLEEEVLEEGLVFFKESKGLEKIVNELTKKLDLLTTEEDMEDREILVSTIVKLERLKNKFKKLELEYAASSKKDRLAVKDKYKDLLNNYFSMIKVLRKENTKQVLKKINMFSRTLIAFFAPYKILQLIAPTVGISLNVWNSSFSQLLKRGSLLTLFSMVLGKPHDLINKKINATQGDLTQNSIKALRRKTVEEEKLQKPFNNLVEAIVDTYHEHNKEFAAYLVKKIYKLHIGDKIDITDKFIENALLIKPSLAKDLEKNAFLGRIFLVKSKDAFFTNHTNSSNSSDDSVEANSILINIAQSANSTISTESEGEALERIIKHEINHAVVLLQAMLK
jgi:BMFP domain-containing protein YqiC